MKCTTRLPPLFAVLATAAFTHAAPSPEQAELAERLLQVGQRFAAAPQAAPVAAAIADVADRLYENDARLLRTAIDLRLSLGHRDKAIAALNALRRLDPGDQIAQVQAIDLQQSRLESAVERADYLTRIAASERVPAEVRAHAAVLVANVESERGRDDAARAAVAQALGLNPLNPKALRMNADHVAAVGTAPQRTAAWANLLKADPLQFATISRLGEELLRAGLTEQATELYRKFFAAVAAAGFGPGTDDSINAAHGLILAGRHGEAAEIAADALKDDPSDARLHALRLLIARFANDDAGYKAALADARTQAVRNLMGLHGQLDPNAPALDSSSEVKLPDVKADAAAARAHADTSIADDYLRALGDLAWVDAYFGQRAPDAAVVDAINALAGANSALAHRTAGFAALAADRLDEADVAFNPVAAQDPLSRLGLLALQLKKNGDKATIVAAGNKLLAEMPTDVWPLIVRHTLKDAGALSFRTAESDAVAAELAKIPADVWTFAARGREQYLVDVDPTGGAVEIGQPILVRVTLQNTSNHALVIGPGGAVSQQVAIDANVRGVAEQSFPASAVAKLTGRLVLPPRQTTSATVRLDNVELGAYLAHIPQAGAAVFISAVTNPITRDNAIVPGPGGYRTQGRGVIDRPQIAYTRPEVREKLARQLQAPEGLRRARAVDALIACAQWMTQAGSEEFKPLITEAVGLINTAGEKDASSLVRAIARQAQVTLAPEADRPATISKMLASPDFESRVLGTLMMLTRPKAERDTSLKALATDADEAVRNLATAIASLPDAQAPATAPAIAPTAP